MRLVLVLNMLSSLNKDIIIIIIIIIIMMIFFTDTSILMKNCHLFTTKNLSLND